MRPEDLLNRLAVTLRTEIGPAVIEPLVKTQAFMAAVVLEKLSAQLTFAAAHAAAERLDLVALADALDGALGANQPASVREGVRGLRGDDAGALARLVQGVYHERDRLGPGRFEACLGLIRPMLRRRLDRQLGYAA